MLIWPNVRVLFLAQAISLAAAGLVLYRVVQVRHPALAPWFLLAFFLNPALHEVALVEFRRVTLAVPFLALALYGLYVRKRPLTALGLAVALLYKEDIALIVLMTGLYLLLFERDWAWGTALAAIGVAWGALNGPYCGFVAAKSLGAPDILVGLIVSSIALANLFALW